MRRRVNDCHKNIDIQQCMKASSFDSVFTKPMRLPVIGSSIGTPTSLVFLENNIKALRS